MSGRGILVPDVSKPGYEVRCHSFPGLEVLLGSFCCLSGCSGSGSVAGSLDHADNRVGLGDDRKSVVAEVACADLLVESEGSDVDRKDVGEVLLESADLELAESLPELTSLLYTDSVTGNLDGDFNHYRLVLGNLEEIYVEAVVLDRMELELVYGCGVFFAVVEYDVDDVGCGVTEKSAKLFGSYCEKNVVDSLAIEVAGNEPLFAEGLDDGLVPNFTDFAVKGEMLHCFFV